MYDKSFFIIGLIIGSFFFATFLIVVAFRFSYISDPHWVAAYFPKSYSSQKIVQIVRKSEARFVRGTDLPGLHVLYADHENLRGKLSNNGVWLTLDPLVLKGCGLISP